MTKYILLVILLKGRKMNKLIKLSGIVLSTVIFTACSGGGSTEEASPTVETITFSGIAVDGYIAGATACLDLNSNGMCGIDEPTTTTKEDGTFTFDDVIVGDNQLLPVIVFGGVDTATGKEFVGELKNIIDSDSVNTGKKLLVSPLTDLVATSYLTSENKGNSALDSAKNKVASFYGLEIDEVISDPMLNPKVFAKTQELQQIKLLLEASLLKVSSDLTEEELQVLRNTITRTMVDQTGTQDSFNFTELFKELEENLEVEVPLNEKDFIKSQVDEMKQSLIEVEGKVDASVEDLNNFQAGLEKSQEKVFELISKATKEDILDIIVIPDANTLSGIGAKIKISESKGGNVAPAANAGANQNITTIQTPKLDGSLSSDANQDELTYLWHISSKPVGSNATLSDNSIVDPIFNPDEIGEYVISLVVNDGIEDSISDAVIITVERYVPPKTCFDFDGIAPEPSVLAIIPPKVLNSFPKIDEEYIESGFSVRKCGGLTLFLEKESQTNIPIRALLHISGDIQPTAINPLMEKIDQSIITDTILYVVAPTFGVSDGKDANGNAITWPKSLKTIIDRTYDDSGQGALSLKEGTHVTGLVTLKGVLSTALNTMKYPSSNIILTSGFETASVAWQSVADAHASKDKETSFLDGLKPTLYIELAHNGLWQDSTGIEGLNLIDTTVYLDVSANFGFWGTGNFNSKPVAMFYNGPLILTADPKDYLGAQVGFGAKEITLQEYINFFIAYKKRHHYLAGEAVGIDTVSENPFSDWLNSGLDVLPLDVLLIKNDNIAFLKFKSGDNFPALKHFNLVALGPLATSEDGTNGPLLKIIGDSYFLDKKFGDINLTGSASGLSATASDDLDINLGSFNGLNIGEIGGNLELRISSDANTEEMTLRGAIQTGPFISLPPLSLKLKNEKVSYDLPGGCTLPFAVSASANLTGVTALSGLAFQPQGGSFNVPDPTALLECAGNFYGMLKDGIMYIAGPAGEYIEMAENLVPSEFKDLAGSTTGFVLDAAAEIPLPVQIPLKEIPLGEVAGEFNNVAGPVVQTILDNEAAAEAARIAAEAARIAAEAAAEAARQAAAAAEAAMTATITQFNNFVNDPAGTLSNLGTTITNIVDSVFCWGSCGSSGPPGFGWHGPYLPIKAIDISTGHNGDNWIIGDDGYPLEVEDLGGWGFYFWYRNNGLYTDFPGFVRIDSDANGYAAAVDNKGRLWTYHGNNWRMTDHYATDVGIGGGYIWITSTKEVLGAGYEIYRAPYTPGQMHYDFQYMHGSAIRIDVGSDGGAWVISKDLKVWEWDYNVWLHKGDLALDITVSASNRAWITSAGDYNKAIGGGRIYTYQTCDWNPIWDRCDPVTPYWQDTEGRAHNIAAGEGALVWVSNSDNNIYVGTGRE